MKASSALAWALAAALLTLGNASFIDVAAGVPELSTLVESVQLANLTEALDGLKTGTVLAPTNDAFEAANGVLQTLGLDDLPITALTETLLYHILPDKYTAEQLLEMSPTVIETLLTNSTLTVGRAGEDTVTFIPSSGFSTANVTLADIEIPDTPDVVVHLINNVLFPVEVLAD